MIRRLVPLLVAACATTSLLAGVAAVVLWPRGYAVTDVFGIPAGRAHAVGIGSEQGSIAFVWSDDTLHRLLVWETRPTGVVQGFLGGSTVAGFGYKRESVATMLAVPNWLIMASAGVAAVLLFRLARKLRPIAPGLCPTCGYDLRASPDRCPECGTAPGTRPSRPIE